MTVKKNTTSAQTAADASGSTSRIIKKYPNRRLYDMANSAYITLADVKQLVLQREQVQVIDAKTGEDLTRSIFLQIILEEEVAGTPIFSEDMLANLIRFYGHTMQGFMGAYIERNIQTMAEMQSQWAEQTKHLQPEFWAQMSGLGAPIMPGASAMDGYAEQSGQAFAKMQEQMQEQLRVQGEQFMGLFGLKSKK